MLYEALEEIDAEFKRSVKELVTTDKLCGGFRMLVLGYIFKFLGVISPCSITCN